MTDDRSPNSSYRHPVAVAQPLRAPTSGKPANRPSDAAFVGALAAVALVGVVALLASVMTATRPGRRRGQ